MFWDRPPERWGNICGPGFFSSLVFCMQARLQYSFFNTCFLFNNGNRYLELWKSGK